MRRLVVLAVKPQQMADVARVAGFGRCRATAAGHLDRRRHPARGSCALAWRGCGARARDAESSGPGRRRRHGLACQCQRDGRGARDGRADHGRVRRDGLGRNGSADGRRDGRLRQRACLFPAAHRGPGRCRGRTGHGSQDRAIAGSRDRAGRGAHGRGVAGGTGAPAGTGDVQGRHDRRRARGARVGAGACYFCAGGGRRRRAAPPSLRATSAPPRPDRTHGYRSCRPCSSS